MNYKKNRTNKSLDENIIPDYNFFGTILFWGTIILFIFVMITKIINFLK